MESKKSKNKLKSFGKNRQERKPTQTYENSEHGAAAAHQERLRQTENPLFNRYYGDLQQLGEVALATSWSPDPPPSTLTPFPSSSSSSSLSSPDAWKREVSYFRQPLPTTFWINDTDPFAGDAGRYLSELVKDGLVEPIAWYPIPKMAWRILADKTAFRKREDMKALRQYLIQQTALGLISRQEEVSMIPPFLLDIQPTDLCLDMCASPGSKTAQMLVALGRHKQRPPSLSPSPQKDAISGGFPFDYLSDGLVVANELDTKRANMLVHQVKRLRLLFPFALFTNHDARYFPDLSLSSSSSKEWDATEKENASSTEETCDTLRFDKILCDVVCSGDGTLRKAPHIFKIWTPREAISLQKMQVQIALRAAHLLKIGGRLVYSTCSLNPIENEAVVAQIVHRTRGAMKLVDVRASLLPTLSCAAGMTHWVVTNPKGEVATQPSELLHEALFPPHTPGGYTSPAVDQLDLSMCIRLLPSHCNGGGFFVAVLDKVAEFRLVKSEQVSAKGKTEEEEATFASTGASGSDEDSSATKKSKVEWATMQSGETIKENKESVENGEGESGTPHHSDASGKNEEKKRRILAPPQFLPAPLSFRDDIKTFFHMPVFPMDNIVIRAATGERELRLTQGSIGSLVSNSALKVLTHKTDALLVVSCGLRLFAHESLSKTWRIAHEAAPLFEHYLSHSPRTLRVSRPFMARLLQEGKGNYKMMHFETMKEVDEKITKKVEDMEIGPVFIVVDCASDVEHHPPSSSKASQNSTVFTVGLRARSGLQLQVDHEDMEGFRLRLGLPEPSVDEKQ